MSLKTKVNTEHCLSLKHLFETSKNYLSERGLPFEGVETTQHQEFRQEIDNRLTKMWRSFQRYNWFSDNQWNTSDEYSVFVKDFWLYERIDCPQVCCL